MENRSLYSIIESAATDGGLPDGFSLPRTDDDLPFADGAQDGIHLYHMAQRGPLSDAEKALVENTVARISEGDFPGALEGLDQIAEAIGPVDAAYPLRACVASKGPDMNYSHLFQFAMTVATQSPDRAEVKLALGLLAGFDPPDSAKESICTLGLSDELTYFAALATAAWNDCNDRLFDLAQRVRGWGRIHLVEALLPETEAIRRWLLREGVHNDVMPQYSALTCWEKADVPAALAGPLEYEDFTGIRDIIEALIDEGPVMGISGVEDAEEHLRAFLDRAREMAWDERDREVAEAVREYLK